MPMSTRIATGPGPAGSLLLAVVVLLGGCEPSDNQTPAPPDSAAPAAASDTTALDTPTAITPEEDAYPLDTCIVSNESLEDLGEPVVVVHEGREVRFCCNDCADSFRRSPARFLAKMDRVIGTAPEAAIDLP